MQQKWGGKGNAAEGAVEGLDDPFAGPHGRTIFRENVEIGPQSGFRADSDSSGWLNHVPILRRIARGVKPNCATQPQCAIRDGSSTAQIVEKPSISGR